MNPRDVYGRPSREQPAERRVVSRRSLLRIPRAAAATREIDFASAHDRVVRGWGTGDHTDLLGQLAPAAELLVELAGIEPGLRVLDAGAGEGNVALAAARAGAAVEACDLAPAMVERGRAHTMAAGPPVEWREADVQELPHPDDSFDAVLSAFGAAYAPRALRTAAELARVTRPSGVLALAAWAPRGLPGGLDELVFDLDPLPDGVWAPSAWGTEKVARRRLSPLLEPLEIRSRTLSLSFASADAAFATLTRPYGLDEPALDAIRPAFERLLSTCNDRPPEVDIGARYLVATGRVRDLQA